MKREQKIYILFIAFLIAVRLFLVWNQPLQARDYAIHDDFHFFDQARLILSGDWLGPYNQYTLIKGPFLPLWIVFTFFIGVPFLHSLHILYIVACLVLLKALAPVLRRPAYSVLLFAILVFNPFTYDTEAFTRVMREGLYTSLCLLVIACAVALFVRREESFLQKNFWALGLGLSFSAAALTREEAVWLLPPLLLLLALSVLGMPGVKFTDRMLKISVWGTLPLFYVIIVGSISFVNYRYYSLFRVTEMNAPEFIAAFSALQRVKPPKFMPLVAVSKATRALIYPVSPAFRELEPYLEGPLGNGWAQFRQTGQELPKTEIAGGWFLWAFRDAVAAAGKYSNGDFPAEYYRTLADEVNLACDSGELSCVTKPKSLAPVWSSVYFKSAFNAGFDGIKTLINFDKFNPYPVQSSASWKNELLFKDLTQNEISKIPEVRYQISGWFVNLEAQSHVVVTRNGKADLNSVIIEYLPSLDVDEYFLAQGKEVSFAKNARFFISTPCLQNKCALEIRNENGLAARIYLNELNPDTFWTDTKTFISVETLISYSNGLQYQGKYNLLKTRVLEQVGYLYQWIFPLTSLAAIVGYIFTTARIKQHFVVWGVLSTFWLVICSRIGLLAIISASSFYSMFPSYMSPVYPVLIGVVTFTLILIVDKITDVFYHSNQIQ